MEVVSGWNSVCSPTLTPRTRRPLVAVFRLDRILGAAMLAATLFMLCFSLAAIE